LKFFIGKEKTLGRIENILLDCELNQPRNKKNILEIAKLHVMLAKNSRTFCLSLDEQRKVFCLFEIFVGKKPKLKMFNLES